MKHARPQVFEKLGTMGFQVPGGRAILAEFTLADHLPSGIVRQAAGQRRRCHWRREGFLDGGLSIDLSGPHRPTPTPGASGLHVEMSRYLLVAVYTAGKEGCATPSRLV